MSFQTPFHLDKKDIGEAETLIADHGLMAAQEAREKARKSRNLGNHIDFCRWREIERYITLTFVEEPIGTIH